MTKKQATKTDTTPISDRFGRFMGRNLPGAAKRLGRATKRAASVSADASARFARAFKEGYDEI